MTKFGYHLTCKNRLYGIKKYGLVPKIGKRSRNALESKERIYFSIYISELLDYWMKRLSIKDDINELVILKFPIDDINYYFRSGHKLVGRECFTYDCILPDIIRVIPLEDNKEKIEYNLLDMAVDIYENENKVVEILADYMIKEKIQNENFVVSSSIKFDNSMITGSMLRNLVDDTSFDKLTEYDLMYYRDIVLDGVNSIYYDIIDMQILDKYGFSDKSFLDLLVKNEYDVFQDINHELRSCCIKKADGSYIIPHDFANIVYKKNEIVKKGNFSFLEASSIFYEDILKYTNKAIYLLKQVKEEGLNNKIYCKK